MMVLAMSQGRYAFMSGRVVLGINWEQTSMAKQSEITQVIRYHSMAIAWPLELIRMMAVVQMLAKYGFMNGRAVPGASWGEISMAKRLETSQATRYHSMRIDWLLELV